MTAYVCGFAFDTMGDVCLIRKEHPQWQRGLLNGVGGKIELDDPEVTVIHEGSVVSYGPSRSYSAIAREFKEEAGVSILPHRWRLFHREQWQNGNSVDFFTTGLLAGEIPTTQTDERVLMFGWRHRDWLSWQQAGLMYNLPYLIPMAYTHLYGDPQNLPYHAK